MAFVVDSRPSAGLGHVRRTIVLANEFRSRGWIPTFYPTSGDAAAMLEAQGFVAMPPEALWRDEAAVAYVDGYCFEPEFFARLADRFALTVVCDDLASHPIRAGVILNHNIYGADLDYSHYACGRVLAGPLYALVDARFAELRSLPRPRVPRLVVSFGGTDDGRFGIPATASILAAHRNAEIDLVLPAAPTDGVDVEAMRRTDRVHVHLRADMAALMAAATHYVGAAGVTLLEALAAGLAITVCAIAENQRINIEALRKAGYPAFMDFLPDCMAQSVNKMQEPSELQVIIDGKGATRVVACIEGLASDGGTR